MLRRVDELPPYALATIRELTLQLRRAGEDVIDLGFGNPDLPSPEVAIAKLQEAAGKPHNHRYSASRGIPRLRLACAELYERRFGVELDPETEVVTTMGAKEGFVHLMWVLLQPGDATRSWRTRTFARSSSTSSTGFLRSAHTASPTQLTKPGDNTTRPECRPRRSPIYLAHRSADDLSRFVGISEATQARPCRDTP